MDISNILLYVVAPLVAFSVVIFIHELGHFLAAKKVGVRVDKFSIGFGPELIGFTKGETRYCISALPVLGGYVQMAGDTPDKLTGESWEFYSASKKNRAFIIIAGPFANFISAIFIYAIGLMLGVGIPTLPSDIGKISEKSIAYETGIRFKDKIIQIDSKPVKTWDDVQGVLLKKKPKEVMKLTVLRDGGKEFEFKLQVPSKQPIDISTLGIKPYISTKIADLVKGFPAEKAGLKAGDSIVSIDGKRVDEWEEVTTVVYESIKKPLMFSILRQNKEMQIKIIPVEGKIAQGKKIVQIGQIGIKPVVGKIQIKRLRPVEALTDGFLRTVIGTPQYIMLVIQGFVDKCISVNDLSGPVGIFHMAGEQSKSGLGSLLLFIGFLSVNLWFFNLLPLPVLDGGHLVLLCIEKLTNKKIAWKVQEVANVIGITLLIALLLMVTYHDILRCLGLSLG
ncbi:RIP metalloprotease RseP [bacterium]|nr:RIP metalloprotease RseP [bacterium]MBU1752796.1 RIP metalloprotease RseP [bacterium]